MIEISEESKAYKYALLCFRALSGEVPGEQYHCKLLDILDEAIAGNPLTAREGLGQLAFSLGRLLAQMVNERLDSLTREERNPEVGAARLKFWSQVEQVDQTPDLDRAQATRMVIRAINKALMEAKRLVRVPYPDLETLKP